jgi:hypothetical protein
MRTTRLVAGVLCGLSAGLAFAASAPAKTNLYWGDTHLHTGNSFDVFLFGTPNSTPDTAYRFAKGLPVISPTTGIRMQLSRPLDFLVVADHAEAMGSLQRLFAGDQSLAQTKTGKIFLEIGGEQSEEELQAVYDLLVNAGSGIENEHGLTARDLYADMHAGEKRRTTWSETIAAAERHNDPGRFTAFIGWEWSAQPNGGNLHRVVFTPDGGDVAGQFLPFSTLESDDPEHLWAWLGETSRKTGAQFVAIPHNPNISIGQMFPLQTQTGRPVDVQYAMTRMKWEPVVEATQIKGDSETHPLLSPDDEFADYETYPFVLTPDGRTPDPTEGDYLRSGLKRGLAVASATGANPYQVGMIGSTDSHTGMSAVEEGNFAGKGQHDATPGQRPHPTGLGSSRGWDMGAAGYVAVWARENTRQAIFDAFQRREVYATTGPRIALRFFAGFDFAAGDLEVADPAAVGYARGVPMGGYLARSAGNGSPRFLVVAAKDPFGANLDRVQIVKGWTGLDGETHERVYDVAVSDGRSIGPDGRCTTPVGTTVDLDNGTYTNAIGDAQLAVLWEDPDFDPAQHAFYYARVLEIPTPRYSLLDSLALGIDPTETGRPATIQERAYGSPVWYTP